MKRHVDTFDLLRSSADELSNRERSATAAHLRDCAECALLQSDMNKLGRGLRDLKTSDRFPASLAERLFDAVTNTT